MICVEDGCVEPVKRMYARGAMPIRCDRHRYHRAGKTPPLLAQREMDFTDCPLAQWLDAHKPEGMVSGNSPVRKHGIRALWRRMIDEHDGLERLF